jgi:hypothetical protein
MILTYLQHATRDIFYCFLIFSIFLKREPKIRTRAGPFSNWVVHGPLSEAPCRHTGLHRPCQPFGQVWLKLVPPTKKQSVSHALPNSGGELQLSLLTPLFTELLFHHPHPCPPPHSCAWICFSLPLLETEHSFCSRRWRDWWSLPELSKRMGSPGRGLTAEGLVFFARLTQKTVVSTPLRPRWPPSRAAQTRSHRRWGLGEQGAATSWIRSSEQWGYE